MGRTVAPPRSHRSVTNGPSIDASMGDWARGHEELRDYTIVLDSSALFVAFLVVALTTLALFYFVTYRSTRSAYCGWWCVALVLFLGGSAAYIFVDLGHQKWATPLGNALLVMGAASIWTAARSLVKQQSRAWLILLPPAVTGGAALADNPGSDLWAGGNVFLLMMALLFGLTARALWPHSGADARTQAAMSVAAGIVSGFYLCRLVVFTFTGPDGAFFVAYLNGDIALLINLILLIAVSFSMSLLSQEQSIRDLRARATRDGLTGLLNRTEFLDLAAQEIRRAKRDGADIALILADLDHFKNINDTYGHMAGDQALQIFATACTDTVRSTDLVGRYGGEEFIFLLTGTSLSRARQITSEISHRIQSMQPPEGGLPTASYGIASTAHGKDLNAMIASADAALYQAKMRGRDRAVLEDQKVETAVVPHTDQAIGGS